MLYFFFFRGDIYGGRKCLYIGLFENDYKKSVEVISRECYIIK